VGVFYILANLRPRLEVYLSVKVKDIDVAEDSGAVHRRVCQRAQLQSQILRRHRGLQCLQTVIIIIIIIIITVIIAIISISSSSIVIIEAANAEH